MLAMTLLLTFFKKPIQQSAQQSDAVQNFARPPKNYAIVDKYLTRSAQPTIDNLVWLKEQGVTDVVNFRTMVKPKTDFDERNIVEKLGMRYHNIPSYSSHQSERKIDQFLQLADDVKRRKGKLHAHCYAGADRTGAYCFMYKSLKKMGTPGENILEWVRLGHDKKRFPRLIHETVAIFIKKTT